MTVHRLKLWPQYFDAVAEETKTHEVRKEDHRRFAVGDILVLREFDPAPDAGYTGRVCIREVTHVLRDPQGQWLQPGVVVLSIRPLGGEDAND